jgi:flagellar biosynthesis/type III secretory pathway protein FliH
MMKYLKIGLMMAGILALIALSSLTVATLLGEVSITREIAIPATSQEAESEIEPEAPEPSTGEVQPDYQKAVAEAYQKGFRDGQKSGEASGYQRGYQKGKEDYQGSGYQKGYDDGYQKGYDDGFKSVNCAAAYQDGYEAGYADGKAEERWNRQSTYEQGWIDGYDEGFKDGQRGDYEPEFFSSP